MASDGAMPQNSELTVNNEMQMRKNRLRPITDTSQPVIGSTIAFETRSEESTHGLSSLLAPRFPAICGSATFAILVSSTSIKAASDTTNAISQGFTLGFHAASLTDPPDGHAPPVPPTFRDAEDPIRPDPFSGEFAPVNAAPPSRSYRSRSPG